MVDPGSVWTNLYFSECGNKCWEQNTRFVGTNAGIYDEHIMHIMFLY